jgi:addiction module HigA family antidote
MTGMMKNPPHPGELIGDSLAELGVTVDDAAEALGVPSQELHDVISGQAAITPQMAVRLEKALGSTADTWRRMQIMYDLAHIEEELADIRAASIEVRRLKV